MNDYFYINFVINYSSDFLINSKIKLKNYHYERSIKIWNLRTSFSHDLTITIGLSTFLQLTFITY